MNLATSRWSDGASRIFFAAITALLGFILYRAINSAPNFLGIEVSGFLEATLSVALTFLAFGFAVAVARAARDQKVVIPFAGFRPVLARPIASMVFIVLFLFVLRNVVNAPIVLSGSLSFTPFEWILAIFTIVGVGKAYGILVTIAFITRLYIQPRSIGDTLDVFN